MIQYHERSEGVQGNYTGINVVNQTACSIDMNRNPNGMCRKRVSGHQTSDPSIDPFTDSDAHDHIEITWTCETKPTVGPIIHVHCNSR